MIQDLINSFEGLKLQSYQDSVGIWTIGFGSILYKNGKHVGPGEHITLEQAQDLRDWELDNKTLAVHHLLGETKVTNNQLDALTDFVYNLGVGALAGSTLLKKVLVNPNDPTIKDEFMRWDKAHFNGKLIEIEGLKNRRQKESLLYFS